MSSFFPFLIFFFLATWAWRFYPFHFIFRPSHFIFQQSASSLMLVWRQILGLCDCSSTFGSCIYVCVCFCLLTTCCTGMGCGAMGAGLHCVVDMVLFCQFWPPVSFFSPGWLQCISGLKENHKHQMSSLMVLFAVVTFLLVETEANFSNNNETLNWKNNKNNDMRHSVTNPSIKSNWVLNNSFYFDFSSCRRADWQKLCMFVTQRYDHSFKKKTYFLAGVPPNCRSVDHKKRLSSNQSWKGTESKQIVQPR